MTSLCNWEGICAKAMIDVCAVCSVVTLLLLWISLGWIKRERFILLFLLRCPIPCCFLIYREGPQKRLC